MAADEGLHERRAACAPGRLIVCVRERCTDHINQHISFRIHTDFFFFFGWWRLACACVFTTAEDVCSCASA